MIWYPPKKKNCGDFSFKHLGTKHTEPIYYQNE